MGSIGIREKIKIHRDREGAAVVLARAYANDKNYEEAARYYRHAGFHRAIWTELKTVNTKN